MKSAGGWLMCEGKTNSSATSAVPSVHPSPGDVRVFEGHAFVVEAAVSVGGRDMKPGLNIYRWGAVFRSHADFGVFV
jgi:hypothetical protein